MRARLDEEASDAIPVANASEYDSDKTLFRMWAGAYGDRECYVWADHFEDAFEEFVEWLDENEPDCLTSFTDADCKDAADELGIAWPTEDDELRMQVYEAAEVDHTVIGHTTLKNGTHIASDEWGRFGSVRGC